MVIAVTEKVDELDRYGFPTGNKILVVSHGYDTKTGRIIIVPEMRIYQHNFKFNRDIGEYILEEE